MKTKMILAGLAGVLVAGGALAGNGKSAASKSSYAFTTSDDGDGSVRIVVGGEGSGNVVVITGKDGERSKTLRMRSKDGRMLFETEPDPDKPWLGVLLTFTDEGVELNSVMQGSPADKAGLQAGDLIVKVDGRDMTDTKGRGGLLENSKPGDRLRFTVLRDGEEERLRVKLGSHPGRVEFEVDEDMGAFGMAGDVLGSLGSLESLKSLKKLESLKGLSMLPFFDCEDDEEPCLPTFLNLSTHSKPRLGVVLETLSPQLAGFFEVKPGEGMLVKEILEGSVAERTGLLAGDVLVQVDDTLIGKLSDVRDSLSGVEKGQSVRVEVVRHGVRESFRAELDTDPKPVGGMSFSVGPYSGLRHEGDQGALEVYERAVESAREARATAPRASSAAAAEYREAAEKRAMKEVLSRAREKDGSGAAARTF